MFCWQFLDSYWWFTILAHKCRLLDIMLPHAWVFCVIMFIMLAHKVTQSAVRHITLRRHYIFRLRANCSLRITLLDESSLQRDKLGGVCLMRLCSVAKWINTPNYSPECAWCFKGWIFKICKLTSTYTVMWLICFYISTLGNNTKHFITFIYEVTCMFKWIMRI